MMPSLHKPVIYGNTYNYLGGYCRLDSPTELRRKFKTRGEDITVGILRWAGGFVLQISPGTTARPCNPDEDLTSSQPCVNAVIKTLKISLKKYCNIK